MFKANPNLAEQTLIVVKTVDVESAPTDMAISDDGLRVLVLTYADAFEYSMDFKERQKIPLTYLQQQESVAYLPGSRSFIYTTERLLPFLHQWIMKVDCGERNLSALPEARTAGIASSFPRSSTPRRISRRIFSSTSGFWLQRSAALRTEPLYMTSNSASAVESSQICGTSVTATSTKPAPIKVRLASSGSLNEKRRAGRDRHVHIAILLNGANDDSESRGFYPACPKR